MAFFVENPKKNIWKSAKWEGGGKMIYHLLLLFFDYKFQVLFKLTIIIIVCNATASVSSSAKKLRIS